MRTGEPCNIQQSTESDASQARNRYGMRLHPLYRQMVLQVLHTINYCMYAYQVEHSLWLSELGRRLVVLGCPLIVHHQARLPIHRSIQGSEGWCLSKDSTSRLIHLNIRICSERAEA